MTSKQRLHAVLFTKDECAPCFKTKVHVATLFQGRPELAEHFSQLAKENHPALIEAYEINLFPTLLITDQNIKGDQSNEVDRIIGGKAVRENLEAILEKINKERKL